MAGVLGRDAPGADNPHSSPAHLWRLLSAGGTAGRADAATKSSSLKRINVDTTGQAKAIARPTDGRLYLKAVVALGRQAKRCGLVLRQSYTRLAKKAAVRAGRYAHARPVSPHAV